MSLKCGQCERIAEIGDVYCKACRTLHDKSPTMKYCVYAASDTPKCSQFATANNTLCYNCEVRIKDMELKGKKPRVMLLTSTRRKCHLFPNCEGSMEARLCLFSGSLKPELWWHCYTCNCSQKAGSTLSVLDPRAQLAREEAEPLNDDLSAMAESIKEQIERI